MLFRSGQDVSSIMGGDLTIQNTRHGYTVTHIYETSSYGLTENGPNNNWPSYQVNLTTRWKLVANFKYRTRTVEESFVCVDNVGTTVECVCDPGWPGCNIVSKTRTKRNVDTDYIGPSSFVLDLTREGAMTKQDPARSNQCTSIPAPIVQQQTVLGP